MVSINSSYEVVDKKSGLVISELSKDYLKRYFNLGTDNVKEVEVKLNNYMKESRFFVSMHSKTISIIGLHTKVRGLGSYFYTYLQAYNYKYNIK